MTETGAEGAPEIAALSETKDSIYDKTQEALKLVRGKPRAFIDRREQDDYPQFLLSDEDGVRTTLTVSKSKVTPREWMRRARGRMRGWREPTSYHLTIERESEVLDPDNEENSKFVDDIATRIGAEGAQIFRRTDGMRDHREKDIYTLDILKGHEHRLSHHVTENRDGRDRINIVDATERQAQALLTALDSATRENYIPETDEGLRRQTRTENAADKAIIAMVGTEVDRILTASEGHHYEFPESVREITELENTPRIHLSYGEQTISVGRINHTSFNVDIQTPTHNYPIATQVDSYHSTLGGAVYLMTEFRGNEHDQRSIVPSQKVAGDQLAVLMGTLEALSTERVTEQLDTRDRITTGVEDVFHKVEAVPDEDEFIDVAIENESSAVTLGQEPDGTIQVGIVQKSPIGGPRGEGDEDVPDIQIFRMVHGFPLTVSTATMEERSETRDYINANQAQASYVVGVLDRLRDTASPSDKISDDDDE
jgi:hypothetical protein